MEGFYSTIASFRQKISESDLFIAYNPHPDDKVCALIEADFIIIVYRSSFCSSFQLFRSESLPPLARSLLQSHPDELVIALRRGRPLSRIALFDAEIWNPAKPTHLGMSLDLSHFLEVNGFVLLP